VEHPATQANLETLRQRGVRVIEPGTGDLACGMVGAGRMAEPQAIADAVVNALGRRHDLAGEVLLVTAAERGRRWTRCGSGEPVEREDGVRDCGSGAGARGAGGAGERTYGGCIRRLGWRW